MIELEIRRRNVTAAHLRRLAKAIRAAAIETYPDWTLPEV